MCEGFSKVYFSIKNFSQASKNRDKLVDSKSGAKFSLMNAYQLFKFLIANKFFFCGQRYLQKYWTVKHNLREKI